jgi:PAS domain S-box-containing protein
MREEKTVLIIDDIDTNIHILIELFDGKYDVLASTDGKSALEILDEEEIDIVLLDINMPVMDGFEVCKRIKENPKTKDIPVIFITASSNEESIEKAYEVGGVDYITKPFKAREVLSRINNHLILSEKSKVLTHDLEENITLLNQYKQVVDESLLVSKTDTKGVITYSNDAFAKISGYSMEELIGKSHNIVRHKDVPKKIYKEMWETIKAKKVWHGEIKNVKKDGSYYIVQATVMPILDTNDEIIEYISARKDVTEIYNLKKEIIATQKEVIFTMGSIGETRSKETGNHVKRVAEYSKLLAYYAGLDDEKIELIVDASPMHDIGKVAIPDDFSTIASSHGVLTLHRLIRTFLQQSMSNPSRLVSTFRLSMVKLSTPVASRAKWPQRNMDKSFSVTFLHSFRLMALLPTPSRRLSSRVNPFPSIFPGPLIVISSRLIPQIREFFQWLCPKSWKLL